MQLRRSDIGTQIHPLRISQLEERLARSHKLALLHILLQHSPRDGSLHTSALYLVGNLALLRAEPFNLRTDAFALLRQTGVVAANLVARGFALAFQHFQLVVDVVQLLAGHSAIIHQLREPLPLALRIGNLLINRRKLLLQVKATAVGSIAGGTQLSLLSL